MAVSPRSEGETETLFSEPVQPRTSPLAIAEPAVNFLLESTWKEATQARVHINAWYRQFPSPQSIRARLLADDDNDHYGAIDELFVHDALASANPNAEIRYEEHGRGPDFRIYGDGVILGAVEVASFFLRDDWQREWRNYGYVADALNERLKSKGLYLQVEPEQFSQYPAKKQLVRFANEYIDSVDELVPYSQDEMREPFEVPASYFTGEGFSIRFQLLPFRTSGPADEQDSIASVGPAIGGMVNSAQRLRGVLRGKLPGRYELEAVPYLVVVVNHDMFCSVETLMSALYGGESVIFSTSGNHQSVRRPDGFFGRDSTRPEGRNRRVSGVALISELAAWAPSEAKSLFFPNPFARMDWPEQRLPTQHRLMPGKDPGDPWEWRPTFEEVSS